MSCETRVNGVGKIAASGAGVPTLVSKASHIQAVVLAKAQASAPAVRDVMDKSQAAMQKGKVVLAQGSAVAGYVAGIAGPENRTPRQQRAARRLALGAKGALVAMSLYNPGMLVAFYLGKKVQAVGDVVGSSAAGFTKTADAGAIRQEKRKFFFFKTHQDVPLWQSSLTSWLNKADLIVQPKKVVSSDGVMFKSGATTWHRGTTVMKMEDGLRTVSHLQSLSLPATHYYFDQPLSDENAVGLATGKVKPETVPGCVGQVSVFEGLSPISARAKHWLIKSYLFFGPRAGNSTN